MNEQIMTILWGLLGTVVSAAVTYAMAWLATFISTKVKDQRLQDFLLGFSNIIMGSVNSLTQTIVEDLKKAGKFDDAAKQQVKADCIELVKSQLTPKMIEFIKNNFGNVEDYISSQIESFILENKKFNH